ncbi:MAG: hypothetical protein QF391_12570, partial [Myxococcota bacterium]|nr:hypothetical protein [Myxococcota bacterium]
IGRHLDAALATGVIDEAHGADVSQIVLVATLHQLDAGDVVFRELLQRLFREGPIALEDQGGGREAPPDFVCGV